MLYIECLERLVKIREWRDYSYNFFFGNNFVLNYLLLSLFFYFKKIVMIVSF